MKTALIVTAMLVCPGIVMGLISSYRAGQRPHSLISSYRAGQRPHRDLYRQLQKFTHRKNKR